MTYENDRNDGEIRRRAAWLLGMLAVVAALIAVVMVFFLRNSSGSSNNADPDANPNYGAEPSTSAPASAGSSGTASAPASRSSTGAATSTSTGPAPKASCPSNDACVVTGDISGAVSAINDLRSQHDLSAVKATTTDEASKCALTSGSDCPQSFVWVHVDDLSGKSVVSAVQGFNGTDNLLDADAKSFAIGWAYDPGSHTSYCAVIRES